MSDNNNLWKCHECGSRNNSDACHKCGYLKISDNGFIEKFLPNTTKGSSVEFLYFWNKQYMCETHHFKGKILYVFLRLDDQKNIVPVMKIKTTSIDDNPANTVNRFDITKIGIISASPYLKIIQDTDWQKNLADKKIEFIEN